ncbi:glycosyltransferase [Mucilaginibacter aquariorum]|uniref:Glycosyltransferase family 2 protein n=1 Tax=Mucilaginibacter aquariorum TaxID=2967225 RepID=A0ABT1SY56_9SPHI|nr:glycosyltransferase [Mucilaginibacter aquariorum]MCQ6957286.1 glycosyltransferase family 2 protein [Mucilaginibacter aquariorum]
MTELSVILSTYNPDSKRLNQTLNGLRAQTLPIDAWELKIIDNNSDTDFSGQIDISWHPNSCIIGEPRQGLTYARLKGFITSDSGTIVMVDDDNILAADYLEQVLKIFKHRPKLGAIGGKSLPLFEAEPPGWLGAFYSNLALRDLGEHMLIEEWNNNYPACAPIGAGMAIRKTALTTYIGKILSGQSGVSDRIGSSLSSGGDNDIVIEILKSGWDVGYFPELELKHIIPAQRMQAGYLARLVNNTNKSWVQLLQSHGINPWPQIPVWGVRPRKIKAWFTCKAWKSKPNYITWRGACGLYDGLANS